MDKTSLIHTALGALASAIKQEREIKDMQTRKKEIKLSPLADYICVENPKEFTENV